VQQKLPLWRLLLGIGVLGCLFVAAGAIVPVYVANYRFAQYVRTLPQQAAITTMPDEAVRAKVVEQARLLKLPVQPSDVTVLRTGTGVQLQIARYKAQVWHADLHFPAIATK
jgi:hypothetical protein